jgi:16S rRNA G966 N2-methylase RsmD
MAKKTAALVRPSPFTAKPIPQTRIVSVDQLIPAPWNPRSITPENFAGLRSSIETFGLVQDPILNIRTGHIVGGHQRIAAIKELGIQKVRCVEVDLSEAEEMALNITLNSPSVAGEFTDDLQALLDQLHSATPDLVDPLNLDDLWNGSAFAQGKTDPDEVPPVPEKPKSKRGEIYQLGEHRLMCGDSLDMNQVKSLIDLSTVDLVFTDPPYGINAVKTVKSERLGSSDRSKAFGAVGGGGRKGHAYPFGGVKNMRGREHSPAKNAIIQPNLYAPVIGDDSTETAIAAYKLCASLGIKTLIFWGGNYYAHELPPSRCWIVWDKENTGTFADGELAWTNIDAPIRIHRHMWNGLMKASERGQARVHPTQKPVELGVWCFDEFAKESKTVMDLFGGSGSTLIACETTKRKCLMMEMSQAYIDVIIKRWEDFTGEKAKRI